MLKDHELQQIEKKNIDIQTIDEQLNRFKKGFPFINITQAATIGNGIIKLEKNGKADYLLDLFERKRSNLELLKFVPASGAASRMFKSLYSFMSNFENGDQAYQDLTQNEEYKSVYTFFKEIEKFSFYEDLKNVMSQHGEHLEENLLRRNYVKILDFLLNEKGLNYGNLPKGLLKFHRYPSKTRTPVEEHFVEGGNYAKGKNNLVLIHFTVSPEHQEAFEEHIQSIRYEYEKLLEVKFDISYSQQKPSTDTIAATMDNEPFRTETGELLFRPGGHGALLQNLNELNYDLIFIKNIDNVVPDKYKKDTFTYKRLLAGMLLDYQAKIFSYQEKFSDVQAVTDELLSDALSFLKDELCIIPPRNLNGKEEKINFITTKLNRPLRVCGMVKNEGEPGGGPYWAENSDGSVSLQIIESSQVNMDDSSQKQIFANATHFNPVDIVCSVRDYKGRKFDLNKYKDPETGFISIKSKDGKDLKALELPGLWNGSMSDWNTVFVEVPVSTFNPVKTINDLLREKHQS